MSPCIADLRLRGFSLADLGERAVLVEFVLFAEPISAGGKLVSLGLKSLQKVLDAVHDVLCEGRLESLELLDIGVCTANG